MTPPCFRTHPRACAVVLAASRGSRLFPMTTKDCPKHLLPVAGIPSVVRLLDALAALPQVLIVVAEEDTRTLSTLLGECQNGGSETAEAVASLVKGPEKEEDGGGGDDDDGDGIGKSSASAGTVVPLCWELKSNRTRGQTIHLVKLPTSERECHGSIDALRIVERTDIVHPKTRLLVVPGDLVILTNRRDTNAMIEALVRQDEKNDAATACKVVLVDVLEPDEHGLPLKESSKSKKGGFSRDKEDIEYIGLSFPQSTSSAGASSASSSSAARDESSWLSGGRQRHRTDRSLPRIVLKQSKMDTEADEDMTGSTAKLVISKTKLRRGSHRDEGRSAEKLVIRTEWSDVHVYSLAPWIRQLIQARTAKRFSSLQDDLLPLLVSRQYRGQKATFGKAGLAALAAKTGPSESDDHPAPAGSSRVTSPDAAATSSPGDDPYVVAAVVLPAKTTLRANTVPAYLFACKEAVARTTTSSGEGEEDLRIPVGSKRNGKFQTLVGSGSTLGSKVALKSATVGNDCALGDKCRLNGVVMGDNVVLGEHCSLQNTLIGTGAVIGNHCSLSDCQVGPGVHIPPFTKEKGEPFVATTTTSSSTTMAREDGDGDDDEKAASAAAATMAEAPSL